MLQNICLPLAGVKMKSYAAGPLDCRVLKPVPYLLRCQHVSSPRLFVII